MVLKCDFTSLVRKLCIYLGLLATRTEAEMLGLPSGVPSCPCGHISVRGCQSQDIAPTSLPQWQKPPTQYKGKDLRYPKTLLSFCTP